MELARRRNVRVGGGARRVVLLAVPWVCTLSRRPPPRCLMCDLSASDGLISVVAAVLSVPVSLLLLNTKNAYFNLPVRVRPFGPVPHPEAGLFPQWRLQRGRSSGQAIHRSGQHDLGRPLIRLDNRKQGSLW